MRGHASAHHIHTMIVPQGSHTEGVLLCFGEGGGGAGMLPGCPLFFIFRLGSGRVTYTYTAWLACVCCCRMLLLYHHWMCQLCTTLDLTALWVSSGHLWVALVMVWGASTAHTRLCDKQSTVSAAAYAVHRHGSCPCTAHTSTKHILHGPHSMHMSYTAAAV